MKYTESRTEYLNEVLNLLPQNPTCVEIGVEKGHFSKLILEVLNPGKLFLVDPWHVGHDINEQETYGDILYNLPTAYSTEDDYKDIHNQFYNEIKNNQVIVRPDFSYNVVNDFPDNYFDFIYIDSCHLYNAVKADLNMFLPKLKEGGLMSGHDYMVFDNFGVIEAVDEFCVEHNFEMIILNNEGFDWTLVKKS